MRKVIKILLSVLSGLMLAMIIIPVLIALLLNVEGIQNLAVRKAGEIITGKLGTEVSIREIRIRGFSRVEAKDFYVEDLAGDTLLYAETLSAKLSKTAILRRNIVIGDINYDNGKIYLYKPVDGVINIQGVLNTFIDKEREKKGGSITLRDIYISNSRFKLQMEQRNEDRPRDINYKNMILDNLTLGCHNMHIGGSKITMDIHGLRFTDRSGFRLESLDAQKFIIDEGLLDFENVSIVTPDSHILSPAIRLSAQNWKKFSNFVDNVSLDVKIKDSEITTATLGYFVKGLDNADIPVNSLDVTFQGPVNNFRGRINNLVTGGTRVQGVYGVKNVTDIDRASFSVNITQLMTDATGVENLASELMAEPLPAGLVDIIGQLGDIGMTLKGDGSLANFSAEVDMASDMGTLTANANLGVGEDRRFDFDGNVRVANLDAGSLLSSDLLGHVSVNGKVKGHTGNGDIVVAGNIGIPRVDFNGYSYGRIWVNGAYENKLITGLVNSNDPNMRLRLSGKADLREAVPQFDVKLNVSHADLHKAGINKRDSVSLLSTILAADFSGSSLENINGIINIDSINYVSPTDSVSAGSIVLEGRNYQSSKYLSMESEFADARFTGELSYDKMFEYLGNMIYDYLPSLQSMDNGNLTHNEPMLMAGDTVRGPSRLTLNVKESNNIASIFLPGFSIAEGTHAVASLDPVTEEFSLTANSDYVEYGEFLVTKLALDANNISEKGRLIVDFTTEDLYLPGFSLPANRITVKASEDLVELDARISNQQTDLNANVALGAKLGRDEGGSLYINASFGPSTIITNDKVWNITDNGIYYDSTRLEVRDFRINNNGQELYANGAASRAKQDTMKIRLNQLDVSLLSPITSKIGYEVAGSINGYANISSMFRKPVLEADINFDDLIVNDYQVEPFVIDSRWDFGQERAVLFLRGRDNGYNYIRGFYRPSTGAYLADINIPNIPFVMLDPLLGGAASSSSGNIGVDIELSSNNLRRPIANGNVSISELSTTVESTKVSYTIPQANVSIVNNYARLAPTLLLDPEKNQAELEASIDLTNFSSIKYDARLIPNNILALNTRMRDNELFYGKIYASGAVNLHGDKMGINVGAVVTTGDNSTFVMPLGGKSSISQADFVVFESRANEEELDVLARKKLVYERRMRGADQRRTNVNIDVTLNVLPNTLVSLELDREANNVLNAWGTASLDMHINPANNDFSMVGTYEIAEGDYILNLQNIIANKKFTLQPGGTIQWMGGPTDALLNVTAAYRLRASLSALGNELGESTRDAGRVPVECIIRLTDRLSQPNIAFEVAAPNADIDTQNKLTSLFTTQEMMARQFVWLVAFNSFYSEAGQGGASNMNIGSSTTSAIGLEFLTSHISNWISNEKADFILRIRPQDEDSSSEVDIGFSTDIIPNRLFLEVEGNVDTRDNPSAMTNTSGYQSNVMSADASLTWIINKSGTIRSKLFTRNIDRFDELRGLQESGVGIYYKEDFDRFSDIIEKAKARSAQRRQRREARQAAKVAIKPEEGDLGADNQ